MVQSERLKQMKAALVDFLLTAHEIPHLVLIVVFGSLLEGDVNKKSDIDLLLVFESPNNPETGIELKVATKVGLDVLRNYSIENNFSFVVVNVGTISKTDKDFLMDVAGKGIIVWKNGDFNFLKKHKEVKPRLLFSYSVQGLSSANKRKLIRKIGRMVELYGEKLGKGVAMFDKKQVEKVERVFRECGASYKKQEILG